MNDQDHLRVDDINVDRSRTGFIKIDIDGFEVDALESAASLLSEANVTLLVEVHSHELESRCIEFLKQQQYKNEVIRNSGWRCIIPELRPLPLNRWIWAKSLAFSNY